MDKSSIKNIRIFDIVNNGNEVGPVYNIPVDIDRFAWGYVCFHRSKDEKVEGHFHKGNIVHNDPQVITVMKGKMKIYCEDLYGAKLHFELVECQEVHIPKFIYHSYEVLSDVIFLEPKSQKFNPDNTDTFTYKDFQELKY